MRRSTKPGALGLCWTLLLIATGWGREQAQSRRDHLTEKEVALVREYQELDLRVEVFLRAARRRLLVLTNPQATQKKKEEELWGPLPTGSQLELLRDYLRILEELEEKLDDALNLDPRNPLLKKALKKAREGAADHLPELRSLAPRLTDRAEQKALALAIEEAERVAAASF
jgi:hypothetical protein